MNADLIFGLGVLGGIVLVLGAIYPAKKVKIPRNSVKNWLFAVGAVLLFAYAVLNYLYGTGTLFFAILEVLAIVSSGLMLGGIPAKFSTKIISALGIGLVGWSIFIAKDYFAAIFILGLITVSWGYVLPSGTAKRNFLLALGSLLIALFSYLGEAWVFFWLNVFFAGFSFYHAWKLLKKD
jgi:hypothetical protein